MRPKARSSGPNCPCLVPRRSVNHATLPLPTIFQWILFGGGLLGREGVATLPAVVELICFLQYIQIGMYCCS